MRSQRRIPPAVAGWLRKADDDLEAARILLNSGSGVHDVVCFHAQQCVETANIPPLSSGGMFRR